jgi:hypothetical protein
MNIALISFGISLAGIIILLGHKIYEMEKGETIISSSVIQKADALIERKIYQRKDEVLAKIKSKSTDFFTSLLRGLHHISFNAIRTVHARTSSLLETMKGRNSKKNTEAPSVSFFLKHVAEVKQDATVKKF